MAYWDDNFELFANLVAKSSIQYEQGKNFRGQISGRMTTQIFKFVGAKPA
jgi:hypothetical protein